MVASRFFALACAAVLLGSPVTAQVAQNNQPSTAYPLPPPPPVAYSNPAAPSAQPANPPAQPIDPGYQPVDPGYQPADPSYLPPPGSNALPPSPPPAPVQPATPQVSASAACATRHTAAAQQAAAQSGVQQDDVVAAAENVFGKGAQGLAGLIQKIFKERGEPDAYIAGREAGGAFVVGLRYGSGTMCHTIEGDQKVYWTGPSVGFDFGADANKVFVLVYNLHDTQELFRRYPNAEGHAYLVGGFSASVLKRDDVILVPIRMGVGVRLGVNGGYMNFSKKSRILPF